MSRTRQVSAAEARKIAKQYGVKLPRVGYEMSIGNGRWIRSAGHSQFGFFEQPKGTKPYSIVCRCHAGSLMRELPACPVECPNAPPPGVAKKTRSRR